MTDWPNVNETSLVSFRDAELKELLLQRGESAGAIAKRDLDRYYKLLEYARTTIDFSQGEAMLLCDALNGCLLDFTVIHPTQSLYANIVGALEFNDLGKKWEVDTKELLTKLRSLSALQAAAAIDAIERFWHSPDSYRIDNAEEKLKEVGLWRGDSALPS